MKMTYLAVGAALASFGVHGAQAQCCAPGKPPTQAATADVRGAAKTIKLDIEGMTCGACSASIKTALKQIDGVGKIDITFEQKGGTVQYDPAKVNEQTIVDAINETGFKAQRAAAEKS
jgi:mercuric ion binding protein